MANPTWTVTLVSVASDGTNLFLEVQISNGTTTMEKIRPVFEVGTSASTITAYLQAIADAKPTVAANIAALQNTSYTAGS